MEKLRKEITSCPKKARTFLVKAGICNPDGSLINSYEDEECGG